MKNVNTDFETIILNSGFMNITEEQLHVANTEAAKHKISLHESIIKLGFANEKDLLSELAARYKLDFVEITNFNIDNEAIQIINANMASHYNIFPLKIVDNILQIATANPFNKNMKSEIELLLDNKYKIQFILTTSDSIKKGIRKAYGVGAATVEQMVTTEEIDNTKTNNTDLTNENKVREASIIKLVNQILADAISSGTTDIHIEPYENDLRVKYRIDGVLHDAGIPQTVRFFREGITSRIKIMSGLDIAEKRLPQDGRAQVDLSKQKYDLRVSILPTRYGEAINIRILPQSTLICDLQSLGIATKDERKIKNLIYKPHGIILVTGPTGSGKTTTLYTCMNLLKDTNSKILTIEDPVEYDMPGIVQMQVHASIGFTFARALRSMLRHDPDIMLVGEIRDLETAETAIRTALTGHLVFSTLHTNDAASAITRLLDMGIEPYLAASSIEAILAQRLVRVICPNCKEEYKPNIEVSTAIKSLAKLEELPTVYHGRGCSKCRFTGYQGRTVITELLVLSDKIRELTISRRHASEIDSQAQKEGMTSLFITGIDKVHRGITTYDEVLKVTKGTVTKE